MLRLGEVDKAWLQSIPSAFTIHNIHIDLRIDNMAEKGQQSACPAPYTGRMSSTDMAQST